MPFLGLVSPPPPAKPLEPPPQQKEEPVTKNDLESASLRRGLVKQIEDYELKVGLISSCNVVIQHDDCLERMESANVQTAT